MGVLEHAESWKTSDFFVNQNFQSRKRVGVIFPFGTQRNVKNCLFVNQSA